jgi:LPXTG-motif cell wall-anchored protein
MTEQSSRFALPLVAAGVIAAVVAGVAGYLLTRRKNG